MRKNISFFCLIAFSIFFSLSVFGQSRLLENYDFADGSYEFVGIFAHMNDHPLQKKLGEFYTDDVATLNALKKAWVFKRPQNQHACGYHYNVLILRNGEEINGVAINLKCHELATSDGSFYFDFDQLKAFSSRFKPLYPKHSEFKSVIGAREYWRDIHTDKNFVYARSPRWLQFEGEFRFRVPCSDIAKDCYQQSDKMLPELRAKISAAYPDENFELRPSGGSRGEVYMIIRCNKSLEEKFDLYDRWNKEAFGSWEAYPLILLSYWKQPVETKTPLSK